MLAFTSTLTLRPVPQIVLQATGDTSLLDAQVPFLEGNAIPEGAEDIYEGPTVSSHAASVSEHAARASHPTRGPLYVLEQYVMAADVYCQPPYVGRGGWSW